MRPIGQWAYGVQLAGGIAGLLILASLAINILLSVVRERDDAATRDLIQDLKDRARQQERRFVDEYAVSVDEAFERLQRLGAGAAWLLAYLVQSIPPEIADKDIAV
jgi:ERCC4-type nuclease